MVALWLCTLMQTLTPLSLKFCDLDLHAQIVTKTKTTTTTMTMTAMTRTTNIMIQILHIDDVDGGVVTAMMMPRTRAMTLHLQRHHRLCHQLLRRRCHVVLSLRLVMAIAWKPSWRSTTSPRRTFKVRRPNRQPLPLRPPPPLQQLQQLPRLILRPVPSSPAKCSPTLRVDSW